MDGGSKEEINNFEEDDLIEPLEDADVDQAVDKADEDDLENFNTNLFWKYFKILTSQIINFFTIVLESLDHN